MKKKEFAKHLYEAGPFVSRDAQGRNALLCFGRCSGRRQETLGLLQHHWKRKGHREDLVRARPATRRAGPSTLLMLRKSAARR